MNESAQSLQEESLPPRQRGRAAGGPSLNGGGPAYKRPFDLTILLLAHLLPPLAVMWILLWVLIPLMIWLTDRRPIFYRQVRVGRNGRVYNAFKFRTMVTDAEHDSGPVWAQPGDPRVTKIGRLLRRTALDELPQIINIWRGDMSLVGPRGERPELHVQILQEVPDFAKRLAVRPGLTGLAQLNGDYDSPPAQKLRHDLEYIERMSPWLDLKILSWSVLNTLKGKWDERSGNAGVGRQE